MINATLQMDRMLLKLDKDVSKSRVKFSRSRQHLRDCGANDYTREHDGSAQCDDNSIAGNTIFRVDFA